MHYATIKYCDIANGPGTRTSLFVSGCRNKCKGCFNEIAWDFSYGDVFDENTIADILQSLQSKYIAGLSLLGGEPMEPENQGPLLDLVRRVRKQFPNKTIWCYTGTVYEKALCENKSHWTEHTQELLSLLDVLVDGPFIQDKADITLRFRGSSNQRLIDMPKTLASGKVVLWEDKKIFSTHELVDEH